MAFKRRFSRKARTVYFAWRAHLESQGYSAFDIDQRLDAIVDRAVPRANSTQKPKRQVFDFFGCNLYCTVYPQDQRVRIDGIRLPSA